MNAISTTPWARGLVSPDDLAVLRAEAAAVRAHVNLTARGPRGPLHAEVWTLGPNAVRIDLLRDDGPSAYVLAQVRQVLDPTPAPRTCPECGDPLADEQAICSGCCAHERVDTSDEADGREGGRPHEWVSRCGDCGSVVTFDGEGRGAVLAALRSQPEAER